HLASSRSIAGSSSTSRIFVGAEGMEDGPGGGLCPAVTVRQDTSAEPPQINPTARSRTLMWHKDFSLYSENSFARIRTPKVIVSMPKNAAGDGCSGCSAGIFRQIAGRRGRVGLCRREQVM